MFDLISNIINESLSRELRAHSLPWKDWKRRHMRVVGREADFRVALAGPVPQRYRTSFQTLC